MKNRINVTNPRFFDRGSRSGIFSRTLAGSQPRSEDLALEQAVTWFRYMTPQIPWSLEPVRERDATDSVIRHLRVPPTGVTNHSEIIYTWLRKVD